MDSATFEFEHEQGVSKGEGRVGSVLVAPGRRAFWRRAGNYSVQGDERFQAILSQHGSHGSHGSHSSHTDTHIDK